MSWLQTLVSMCPAESAQVTRGRRSTVVVILAGGQLITGADFVSDIL
jgi:hypothetical protein